MALFDLLLAALLAGVVPSAAQPANVSSSAPVRLRLHVHRRPLPASRLFFHETVVAPPDDVPLYNHRDTCALAAPLRQTSLSPTPLAANTMR